MAPQRYIRLTAASAPMSRVACFTAVTLVSACALAVSFVSQAAPRAAQNHRWYVSANASAGGDGTINSPFNTLAAVEQASSPGDTILIEPSALDVPPLDGGIA